MKILMVCLGNICRSPMAEGILRKLAKDAGIAIETDSAGTGGWHAGEPPDLRAIEAARSHNIDISDLRARKFAARDFDYFDRIYVMDLENYHDVMRKAGHARHQQKVSLLLNELHPGKNQPVPDPWYDDTMFEPVFRLIHSACEKIIERYAATAENRETTNLPQSTRV
jgi:protein-tyrosine phosphatase